LSRPFENINDFEVTFREYYNPLVNFVNRYLNNFENSKEVVQATFVKIWEHKDKIEVHSSIKSYLFQVSKNSMIDFIRKNKNHLNNTELDTNKLDFFDDDGKSLDPYIVRQAIEHCLKDKKEKAREIFMMNKYEGLTYEEIADYLNISKRSVEDNISKILAHLKEELKNHPDFFD